MKTTEDRCPESWLRPPGRLDGLRPVRCPAPPASRTTPHGGPARTRAATPRLIHYLWKNHHTTPFEAVSFTFEIKAPIFVFRQWHRHRTWSYNELSARYRELPEEFYLPDPALIGAAVARAASRPATSTAQRR